MCQHARLRIMIRRLTPSYHVSFTVPEADEPITRPLPLCQLRVFLSVVPPGEGTGPMLDAVISTGEPLSVIPWEFWGNHPHFGPCITWLDPPGTPGFVYGPNLPLALTEGIPGADYWQFRDQDPFRLGMITVSVFNDEGHQLCPRRMIARFLTQSSSSIREPLVGLEMSILANRRFTRNIIADEVSGQIRQEWWLDENLHQT
jgi:hypothetical protein